MHPPRLTPQPNGSREKAQKAQAGGAENPKLEIQNPKQIRMNGNSKIGETKTRK
jgi:hypothetical protein